MFISKGNLGREYSQPFYKILFHFLLAIIEHYLQKMGCSHPIVQKGPGDNLPARTLPVQNATNSNNLQQTYPQTAKPRKRKFQNFNQVESLSPGINPSVRASPLTSNYSRELLLYHHPSKNINMNSLVESHSKPTQPPYYVEFPPPTANSPRELQPNHPPSDNINSPAKSQSQPAQPPYHGGYPPPTRSYGGLPPSHSGYAQQGQPQMGN